MAVQDLLLSKTFISHLIRTVDFLNSHLAYDSADLTSKNDDDEDDEKFDLKHLEIVLEAFFIDILL